MHWQQRMHLRCPARILMAPSFSSSLQIFTYSALRRHCVQGTHAHMYMWAGFHVVMLPQSIQMHREAPNSNRIQENIWYSISSLEIKYCMKFWNQTARAFGCYTLSHEPLQLYSKSGVWSTLCSVRKWYRLTPFECTRPDILKIHHSDTNAHLNRSPSTSFGTKQEACPTPPNFHSPPSPLPTMDVLTGIGGGGELPFAQESL